MDTVLVEAGRIGRTYRFVLRQLSDYDAAASLLERTTRSAWTATLTVEAEDGSPLGVDDASSLADDFLVILSFALSRRAAWAILHVTEPSGEFTLVRPGTNINLKSLPGSVMGGGHLVVGRSGQAEQPLSEFMEVALRSFWELEKRKQDALREAIECMCESVQRFFSPAAIALVGRAFESLCDAFLDSAEQSYLSVDCEQHAHLKDALRAHLESFAASWRGTEKESAEEWSTRLNGHISNLLQRPFKLRLRSLLDRWLVATGNPYDTAWANRFVDARNSAAHCSEVREREFDSWIKGSTLLSRTLLKILGYSGPYVDFYGDGLGESRWSALR
jgi:hypothetical protein